jgi:hypothetical protein
LKLLHPGGQGPRTGQGQGSPFISPITGIPSLRLLRLAGIRWNYSDPSPHRLPKKSSYEE